MSLHSEMTEAIYLGPVPLSTTQFYEAYDRNAKVGKLILKLKILDFPFQILSGLTADFSLKHA